MDYDIIVIGAGHAGVEACLSVARLGNKTLLVTFNKNKIAMMPCNPSIGGPAKGIVVREIDALGGEMAKAADATSLQMKLLNSSRGPAVWALRAQSDKIEYSKYMEKVVNETKNLDIKEAVVAKIIVENNIAKGIELQDGEKIFAKTVILTTGTYMSSLILQGCDKKVEGPDGEKTTNSISSQLEQLGFEMFRLKTGTPPRILKDSIDFSQLKIEPGTDAPLGFSYSTVDFAPIEKQELCWMIHSTSLTKEIVTANLEKSAMYSGNVKGTGPRYCPSFEDKVTRFYDKETHQIFLEPESKSLDTIYVQGFSTSMPIEIQEKMIKTLPGMQNAKVVKWAYAIEYDAIYPTQLKHSLETKKIANLFTAGQINGTSGYEEAACQGLIAGINAHLKIKNLDPFVLRRDEAYIGVLIDDLVTKGTYEPYRLLTSRAEYRLFLRNDNAEVRLKKYGYELGLVDEQQWIKFQDDLNFLDHVIETLKITRFTPLSQLSKELSEKNMSYLTNGQSAFDILKRPEVDINIIKKYVPSLNALTSFQIQNLLITIRFEGYIVKERQSIERFVKLEKKQIPKNVDYDLVENLAGEAREKFKKIQPISIGQASRISGINPSDVQMLLFHLRKIYPEYGN